MRHVLLITWYTLKESSVTRRLWSDATDVFGNWRLRFTNLFNSVTYISNGATLQCYIHGTEISPITETAKINILFTTPTIYRNINPLKPELNPMCCLLALLGAHHFLHVSRIRVKLLTFRLLMSYIYIYIYIWSTHSWCF